MNNYDHCTDITYKLEIGDNKILFINEPKQLDDFFSTFHTNHSMPSKIYFDTEFHKRTTYWATLCVLQIKILHYILIIDATTVDISKSQIHDIMNDVNIMKICHACEQDIQTLQHADITVNNCFDTQIGASFCQLGYPTSYQTLVELVTKVKIDKKHQESLWNKRPLSSDMINYAAEDVYYLEKIFHYIKSKLDKQNRFAWVEEEVARMLKAKKKPMLHLWRDAIAQKQNIPPNWVIDSKTMHNLTCNKMSFNEIKCALPNKLKKYTDEVYQIVSSSPQNKCDVDSNLQNSLNLVIKSISEKENLPAKWLCDSTSLRFICINQSWPDTLGIWRKILIWHKVQLFIKGHLGLKYLEDKLQTFEIQSK